MTRHGRVLGWLVCAAAFLLYAGALLLLALLGSPRPRRRSKPLKLLLTGRFDSRNWCRAHLLPLAEAAAVGEILAAVDGPLLDHPKVRPRPTPGRLRRLLGRSPARSLWVLWLAARHRPDLVLGYHFFPAGVSALLAARLCGARALYSMTGGPVELTGGGVATESPWVPRTSRLARSLEPAALRLCRYFDVIVVRGRQARAYLERRRAARATAVIPGSIDLERFQPGRGPRRYDVVFVGRLVPVKQPELFVRTVALLARRRPDLKAVVVGDGPLRPAARHLARSLNLDGKLAWLGHVERVEDVLAQSKVFTLTSRSEGLSIALAEAMAAGAVPVVFDVGDLGELVRNGRTGWLVPPGDPAGLAERIQAVLDDPKAWARLSRAARQRACENNALSAVTARWVRLLRPNGVEGHTDKQQTLPGPRHRTANGWRRIWSNVGYRFWQDGVPPWIKRTLARPLACVPPERLLGRDFRQQWRFVQSADRWPADLAREYQLKRLQAICRLAWERSPYYRRVFRDVGFEPGDLKRPEDLEGLPTIDRHTLRRHLDEMGTLPPDAPGVDAVATSGTGGEPLHFYMNADRAAVEYAHLVVSWQRAGYRLGLPMAVFRGRLVRPDRRGFRHEYDPILRHHYYSVFHLDEAYLDLALDHVRGLGPCFLHVYPSAVAILARHLRRRGQAPPANVLGIIAESEIVYPEQRRFVEEVFGRRFFSCYGHTEKAVLAAECEAGDDYHVWPTYGYFELLDEDGRPVRTAGQRGEIVATGFINTVVPFIRYRTGDWATYVGARCPACGREQVIIRDVRGHRTQETLVAADGGEIPWAALNAHDDTFLHVRQFQFRQDVPGHAVLRLVPLPGFEAADRERILAHFRRRLGTRLRIDVELTDAIPLSPRGKTIYVDRPHWPARSYAPMS